MAKFHVNGKGEAGKCSAVKGNCPFGSDDEHYTSAEAARAAFESSMTNFSEPAKITASQPIPRENLRLLEKLWYGQDIYEEEFYLPDDPELEAWERGVNDVFREVHKLIKTENVTIEEIEKLYEDEREDDYEDEHARGMSKAYGAVRTLVEGFKEAANSSNTVYLVRITLGRLETTMTIHAESRIEATAKAQKLYPLAHIVSASRVAALGNTTS